MGDPAEGPSEVPGAHERAPELAPRLVAAVDAALHPGDPILLLARGPAPADVVRRQWPQHPVDLVVHDGDVERLHAALAAHDRAPVVLDLCRGAGGIERLQRAALHLAADGTYVASAPRRHRADRAALEAWVAAVTDLHDRDAVVAPVLRVDERTREVRDLHGFAAAVASVELHGPVLVARAGRRVLARVDERHTADYLAAAPARGTVLDRTDAGSYVARGTFTSSSPDAAGLSTVRYPALVARDYADVVCHPRRRLEQGDVVLAESFRNPLKRRGRTPLLHDWSPGFLVDRHASADVEPERLDGRWYYLDNAARGHFGHAFTEQLGHLWAWERVAGLVEGGVDGILLLGGADVADWERELFSAAGVPPERIRAVEGPVRVERLVGTTQAYVIGHYVHPMMLDRYRAVGEVLRARASADAARPARVFVTRHGGLRPCRNVDEVEERFADAGFAVVRPETLSLPDQAALFGDAEVVAGFAGSGMFPFVCSPSVRQVVAISSTTYHAVNEVQLAALAGVDVTITRSAGEVTTERFSNAMFHSGFTVDWRREGRLLLDLLETLD